MLDPAAMILADRGVRRQVSSARPGAPVVPATASRPRRAAARRLTAGALRRLADAVEPRRPTAHPA
jgi:hypothetical protein